MNDTDKGWLAAVICVAIVCALAAYAFRCERDMTVTAMERGYEEAVLPGRTSFAWVKAGP